MTFFISARFFGGFVSFFLLCFFWGGGGEEATSAAHVWKFIDGNKRVLFPPRKTVEAKSVRRRSDDSQQVGV